MSTPSVFTVTKRCFYMQTVEGAAALRQMYIEYLNRFIADIEVRCFVDFSAHHVKFEDKMMNLKITDEWMKNTVVRRKLWKKGKAKKTPASSFSVVLTAALVHLHINIHYKSIQAHRKQWKVSAIRVCVRCAVIVIIWQISKCFSNFHSLMSSRSSAETWRQSFFAIREELFPLASLRTPILHRFIYKKEASSGQKQFEFRLSSGFIKSTLMCFWRLQ